MTIWSKKTMVQQINNSYTILTFFLAMHAAIRKLVPRDLWGRNAGDVADELHFVAFFHGLVPTRPLVHDL